VSPIRRRHRPGKATIELTPLVDVSLILVVFMLLNNQRADLKQLPVSLPATAGASDPVDQTHMLRVVVDRSGTLSVAGEILDLETLLSRVGADTTISLLADRDCRHGEVVTLVDRLRQAGAAAIYYASEELDDVW
jgi:biopolymer transport protein ExbD